MTVTAPPGLAAAGKKLWDGIASQYQLREDELRLLRDACFEADLIEKLNRASGGPVMVRGFHGQTNINPIFAELRQHRATLASLLKQLKLPDSNAPVLTEEEETQRRSADARAAANARWARRGA